MDTAKIAECSRRSFANTPFPLIVPELISAGVRSYRVDLLGHRSAYYDRNSAVYEHGHPDAGMHPVADAFDDAEIVATLRAIQSGQIGYAEFLRRIAAAGCASYCVYMGGRMAVYYGRDGQAYVEQFPPTLQ
jgi:uncharacterized protein YbcV (DUF1398 family)